MTYIMHALKEHGMDVDVTATTVEEARDTILWHWKVRRKKKKEQKYVKRYYSGTVLPGRFYSATGFDPRVKFVGNARLCHFPSVPQLGLSA